MSGGEIRLALLDRDGTIIRDMDYLSDPDGLEFLPGAVDGLKTLAAMGFTLAIVTNQSGVARGYFTLETAREINDRLVSLLAGQGVRIAHVAMCPHGPDEGCDCRKPMPGLARSVARALDASLDDAVVIGDKASDIGLATAIGAKGVLISESGINDCAADAVAADLVEAAAYIAIMDGI